MLLSLPLDWWSSVKFALFQWFLSPARVLWPLVGAMLAVLLLLQKPWRQPLTLGLLTLVIGYLALISPLGATLTVQGLMAPVPQDSGQPADAIVILGRGSLAEQERAQRAANLWHQGRAPFILATGRGEAPRLVGYLRQAGVTQRAIMAEPSARTTEENAKYSVPLLRSLSAQRIILVTDQPHILRSWLTFRSFGFEVVPYPVEVPKVLPAIQVTALALREYAGLLNYSLLGRFSPRATEVRPKSIPSTSQGIEAPLTPA